MRELRRRHGWSGQKLAEEMTKVGIPWDRHIVANLETGRRRSVSVEELLALAYVLSVAPVHLLVPPATDSPVHLVPRSSVDAKRARRWIRGLDALHTDERIYFSEVPRQEFGIGVDNVITPALMWRMLDDQAARDAAERRSETDGQR